MSVSTSASNPVDQAIDPMRRRWIFALGGLLAAGCSSAPPASDATPYSIRIKVADRVNPDRRGRPSPILVGIYALKSADAFGLAGFTALQDNARAALGDNLVSLEQMVLVPGEERVIKRSANDMVRAVGFVAGYQKLEQSVWRSSVELRAPRRNALVSKIWPFPPDPPVISLRVGERRLASDINKKSE